MAPGTITYTGTLEITRCWCHIRFAVPDSMWKLARQGKLTIYCPHGHSCTWDAKTDEQLQRERAVRAERQAADEAACRRATQDQLDASERSRRALKGHLTRIKNRIANGVCPVPGCKRTGLVQTMRHIATKHPTWHAEHADELHT